MRSRFELRYINLIRFTNSVGLTPIGTANYWHTINPPISIILKIK